MTPAQHIAQLIENIPFQHELEWDPPTNNGRPFGYAGWAYFFGQPSFIILGLPHPTDDERYAAGLHEFGHLHRQHYNMKNVDVVSYSFKHSVSSKDWELESWEWAILNAQHWTSIMTSFMEWCLKSYGIMGADLDTLYKQIARTHGSRHLSQPPWTIPILRESAL